ncbi:tyrosine-protein phosphatase [Bacteroides sp.]|uniref:tyrosine-protein phosphatase n=1 Tax=Bacteroides sp. TaxID=29523 RepID=UPI00260A6CD4|nr:tyrosine-protein phosphatase [Bacteroides sp.]MDD3037508.1 tyrosine-protein phosphatase [Bacteroides sp.]
MQKQILFCFLGLILSLAVYGQTTKAEKVIIPDSNLSNIYQIDSGVYRSEQPTDIDFKALEKFGIREVLNLRRWHSDDDEAEGTTLKLHRLKMRAGSVSEERLIEALRIIYNRKGPILIHCHHGSDRTGIVCALYRIIFQNVSKEDAIYEMTGEGFGFHKIYKNLVREIQDADIEQIKEVVTSK